MGGDLILAQSEPQAGSTFVASVLVRDTEESYPRPQQSKTGFKTIENQIVSLEGCRVLVVEDSADNRALMEIILKRKGVTVDFAVNGEEGYRKALSQNYDVVLMDIQMPAMDGYAATQRLREQGYTNPIIAVTANASVDDRLRCLANGCSEYVTKPIEPTQFIQTIVKTLQKHKLISGE